MPNRLISGDRLFDGILAFASTSVSLSIDALQNAEWLEVKAALIAIGVLALKEAGKVLFRYLEKKYLNADKPGGTGTRSNDDHKPPGHTS